MFVTFNSFFLLSIKYSNLFPHCAKLLESRNSKYCEK